MKRWQEQWVIDVGILWFKILGVKLKDSRLYLVNKSLQIVNMEK